MMKGTILKWSLCITAILANISLIAREPLYSIGRADVVGAPSANKTGVADCEPATSQFDLDVNNIRAKILNGGDFWWNLSDARYEVPKVDPPGSAPSVHSLFAGALWISGLDEGGNLKLAAQTYRRDNDFWPGPLDADGQVENATCKLYDKHFNVYSSEILALQAAYNAASGGRVPSSSIAKNVLEWPGKGNPYLRDKGMFYDDKLAPFFDNNDDGIYDPADGDYPVINSSPNCEDGYTFADQMIFWVFNDAGNVHTHTQGDAIGLQINALAFAFKTSDELNNMTFYRYNIINKSNTTLRQTYMGQWVDPDMGCYNDDYIGCDTNRALGVIYNGASTDPDCQSRGYGSEVPLLGIDYFEGPRADLRDGIDNDRDGLTDEGTDGLDNNGNTLIDEDAEQELLGMSSFVYFNNAAGDQGDPRNAAQYRNYMTGRWADGNPITFGGTGKGGTRPVNHVYPGDPSISSQWSECNNQTSGANTEGDRRFVQISGPFSLKPGDENNLTIGVIWVRPKSGAYPCPSFSKFLGPADDKAQALFDNCFKVLRGPDAPSMLIRELDKEIILSLVNSASSSNNKGESYDEEDALIKNLPGSDTLDITYTFQGYRLYQLKDGSVSTSDLNDDTKAKLIAQVDLKDGIANIINYEFNDVLNADVPVLKVEGADKGLQHSFQITKDAFASGDPKLVNHKSYYFTAIAYAHNEYQKFLPLAPLDGGQKTAYLQGNGNLQIYTAIPHIVSPRNEGTTLNAKFGDSIAVTRIQGTGTGGNSLYLSQESEDAILASPDNKLDILKYVKGGGPISVKVIDPLKLTNSTYRMVFTDTALSGNRLSKIARWILVNVTTNDTVFAEKDLSQKNDQVIYKNNNGDINPWGFEITIGQSDPVYTANYQSGLGVSVGAVFGPTNSNVVFADREKPWLSFLQDEGQNSLRNWIRSGDYIASGAGGTANPLAGIYDDHCRTIGGTNIFHDKDKVFDKMIGAGWAPYCLAANYANVINRPTADAPERFPFTHAPGFKWNDFVLTSTLQSPQNTLDSLFSCMIVLTPDKSKWSRCIVFETGEEAALNEPNTFWNKPGVTNATITASINSHKGEIRSTYSRDKNGNLHGIGSLIGDPDTGRSWFPGYAINTETGERLNIAFGESSDMADQNGRDMIWNPTNQLTTVLNDSRVLYGGKHFIYVFKTKYDECASYQRTLIDNFNGYTGAGGGSRTRIPVAFQQIYRDIMYTSIPYISNGYKLNSLEEGLIPTETRIYLGIDKPYERFFTTETKENDSLNVYEFSTLGLAPLEKQAEVAKTALDLINVVPNPYYAYGGFYETSPLETKVKITNLPNKCTVSIYTLDGTLIKKYDRDIPGSTEISDGSVKSESQVNIENSLEWDLKNFKNIPISSGMYLIHIEAPGIGERTLKWFGALRPTDVDSF